MLKNAGYKNLDTTSREILVCKDNSEIITLCILVSNLSTTTSDVIFEIYNNTSLAYTALYLSTSGKETVDFSGKITLNAGQKLTARTVSGSVDVCISYNEDYI